MTTAGVTISKSASPPNRRRYRAASRSPRSPGGVAVSPTTVDPSGRASEHRLEDVAPQVEEVVALVEDERDRAERGEPLDDGAAVRVEQAEDRLAVTAARDEDAAAAALVGGLGRRHGGRLPGVDRASLVVRSSAVVPAWSSIAIDW